MSSSKDSRSSYQVVLPRIRFNMDGVLSGCNITAAKGKGQRARGEAQRAKDQRPKTKDQRPRQPLCSLPLRSDNLSFPGYILDKEFLLMKKQRIFALSLAAFVVLAGAVIAGGRTDEAALVAPAIGTAVEDFSLPDTNGKSQSLNSLKGKNGSVLIFISAQCPVSNAYNERMEALAQDFAKRGISVIGINANATESAEMVKAHASEKHLTFPVLKDPGNKIADKLGATRTPEAYLLDG